MGGDDDSSTAQTQRRVFTAPSGTFRVPCDCRDVCVTLEGHLLLAAREQGMRKYNSGGVMLSSWKPPKRSSGEDDSVNAVAALDDGRAAVGVLHSRLVLLLQYRPADKAWFVDRRLAEVAAPPRQLSVQGDLIAIALSKPDGQQRMLGSQLHIIQLADGQKLYEGSREYDVNSVALTSTAIITASLKPIKLSDRTEAYVVDCYSHGGERVWRHEPSSKEEVVAVCAAPKGYIYVGVNVRSELGCWSYLKVIDGDDGKELKGAMVSQGVCMPRRVSVSRGQPQVLAVLSRDEVGNQWNQVAVYTAVSS